MATKTSFKRWMMGVTLAAVGLWHGAALAAGPPVPATLTQQGRILDAMGAPVSSKVHFVFTLYDSATASKAVNTLWTEEQDITLDDGYFSTELGSVTAIPDGLFDGSQRFLGVTVGSDDEMSPRQTLSSVPYALLAGAAATVPFTGISGIPAACADGKYLKGFDAAGAAVCGALPALSCHTVAGTQGVGVTSAFVGCPSGEVATGGGCTTNGTLMSSYLYFCSNIKFCNILCLPGNTCLSQNDYYCATNAAATITPSVRCCTVQ